MTTEKKGVKAKETRGLRRSAAHSPLCPLSTDYPLSWGRTESPSEAEYEQHGKEQLTIAQTPRAKPPAGKGESTQHPLLAREVPLARSRASEARKDGTALPATEIPQFGGKEVRSKHGRKDNFHSLFKQKKTYV